MAQASSGGEYLTELPPTRATGVVLKIHPNPRSVPLTREDWIDVHFSRSQGGAINLVAQGRVCVDDDADYYAAHLHRQRTGVSGEVATPAWLGGTIQTEPWDDYGSDGGIDHDVPLVDGRVLTVQTKTSGDPDDPTQSIAVNKIDAIDILVMCTTRAFRDNCKIVGYIPASVLQRMAKPMRNDDEISITPDILLPPPGPARILPPAVGDVLD